MSWAAFEQEDGTAGMGISTLIGAGNLGPVADEPIGGDELVVHAIGIGPTNALISRVSDDVDEALIGGTADYVQSVGADTAPGDEIADSGFINASGETIPEDAWGLGLAAEAVAPVAAFSGTPLTGTDPVTVTFTDESTHTPTSWLWEKNDGGGWVDFDGTPTMQNPTEDFAEGTWSVRLTATNAGGSDDETKTDYVEVDAAASFIVATGGTITTDGNYKIHRFTASGNFQVTSGAGDGEILLVGGGGAGGNSGTGAYGGGGGGAGGVIHEAAHALAVGTYPVVIGAGGTVGAGSGGMGTNGGVTTFDGLTALGGGRGAASTGASTAGAAGGSGGGGMAGGAGGAGSQGSNGGGSTASGQGGCGGGGGASAVGASGNSTNGGAGGAGVAYTITGASVTYAGGGGGGTRTGTPGAGGAGGGGTGNDGAGGAGNSAGTAGTANTGGGGGGAGGFDASFDLGAAGGSGVFIVRYQYQ